MMILYVTAGLMTATLMIILHRAKPVAIKQMGTK